MRKKVLTFLCGLALLVCMPIQNASADADCYTSQALIVLDQSSSMMNMGSSGDTLWAEATEAIDFMTGNYEEAIDFGLMLFPYPDKCSPGQVVVEMAPMNSSAINAQMQTPPPSAGNWTPMAESLDAAANHAPLIVMHRPSFVILITDGWQWCSPYDPATRFLPVESVENLASLGIPVYVVGFTQAVDTLTLNRMAVAGGTAHAGCDETQTDPGHPSNCYYHADDYPGLADALQNIAMDVVHERPCGTDEGECEKGIQMCINGAWGNCIGEVGPTEEVCDGRDNNCNGITDEGCDCLTGETRPCGTDEGECSKGVQVCNEDGTWSDHCEGAIWPTEEVCDGRDNNCDGRTDEDLFRECETACGVGIEVCVNGNWYGCSARQPSPEVCDGTDNDCNGLIDDGDDLCDPGWECINGECVPLDPGDNDGPGLGADSPSSCGCRTLAGGAAPPIYLLLLLGLAVVLFKRRD